jgi:hypothetical protein
VAHEFLVRAGTERAAFLGFRPFFERERAPLRPSEASSAAVVPSPLGDDGDPE